MTDMIDIGVIRTPYTEPAGMPIQPPGTDGSPGTVVMDEAYAEALRDLDGFSHLILVYRFHRGAGYAATVTPFLDDSPRGVFATRAPRRPNPIGLSVVGLDRIEGCTLHATHVDVLDGTPLLDIKPFVPAFDAWATEIRTGWLERTQGGVAERRADDRFA